MLSGVCPKCHQDTIHVKERGVQIGDTERGLYVRTKMMVSPCTFRTYICASCGYLETYIADQAKLVEVASAWEKVASPAPGFDI
jgi:predicted nucleic-acid-binding Zn-ribbon protein